MEFIDIPTEQTTAVTDALLAVIAILAVMYMHSISHKNKWKTTLWMCFFGFMTLVYILGTIIHGFKISPDLQAILWYPLYFLLCLSVGIFMVAAVYDIWGENIAHRSLPVMIFIAGTFFCITLFWSNNFLVFIIYESVILSFALVGYIWLAFQCHLEGAGLMSMGISVTLIAAAIQVSNSLSFTFIWSFDHNGVFHLVQMAGIVLILSGVRKILLFG